jgi:hypothetical protein
MIIYTIAGCTAAAWWATEMIRGTHLARLLIGLALCLVFLLTASHGWQVAAFLAAYTIAMLITYHRTEIL